MAMAKFGLNWLSSTVFKNAGQNQSQIDRFRSAFRLTQERKEKFLPALDRPYQALQGAFSSHCIFDRLYISRLFLYSYYLTCSCSSQATINDHPRIGTAEFSGVDARK